MTAQIADALMENLHPKGVMVLAEAEHMCMTMRGIKKPGSKTVSVVTRGAFEENEKLQNMFFRMIGQCDGNKTKTGRTEEDAENLENI